MCGISLIEVVNTKIYVPSNTFPFSRFIMQTVVWNPQTIANTCCIQSINSKLVLHNSYDMPKVKIGAKVTAGENKKEERKVFTNGHKVFTAQEAKRLLETQTTEKRTVANFEANMSRMIRPRNPLTGDSTPRLVYDKNGVGTQTGEPLFTSDHLRTLNASTANRPNQMEVNPLKRSNQDAAHISSLQNMQDNINGELAYLKMKMQEKQDAYNRTKNESVIRF